MRNPVDDFISNPSVMAAELATMMPLNNSRHEMFCQVFVKGKNKTEAYLAAGYRQGKRKSLSTSAARLASKPKVAARIHALQEMAASLSIHALVKEAEQIRRLAIANDQPTAALSALNLKTKFAGMLDASIKYDDDKHREPGEPVDPEKFSDAELLELIKRELE